MRPDARHLDQRSPQFQAAGALRRSGGHGRDHQHGQQYPSRRRRPSAVLHALISLWPRRGVKRRARPIGALLLAALLTAGCSGAKAVYDRLDVLLPWYLRDYVDLDDGQRSQLDRAVSSLLTWHRDSEVGRYAAFFRELAADAAGPLPPGRIESARLEIESFWDDIARRAAPDAAALLATLTEAQVEELFARIAREDRELADEALGRSPEQRMDRRERALRRQLERWTGRLDARQQAMVAACARAMRGDTEGWLQSRGAWQVSLREAFSLRDDPEAFSARLERLFADGEDDWTPAYRENFQSDRRRVLQLLEEVEGSLSDRQRSHLRERLERWALDLDAIAGGA